MITREEAFELLRKYNKDKNKYNFFKVSSPMRAFCSSVGSNVHEIAAEGECRVLKSIFTYASLAHL